MVQHCRRSVNKFLQFFSSPISDSVKFLIEIFPTILIESTRSNISWCLKFYPDEFVTITGAWCYFHPQHRLQRSTCGTNTEPLAADQTQEKSLNCIYQNPRFPHLLLFFSKCTIYYVALQFPTRIVGLVSARFDAACCS